MSRFSCLFTLAQLHRQRIKDRLDPLIHKSGFDTYIKRFRVRMLQTGKDVHEDARKQDLPAGGPCGEPQGPDQFRQLVPVAPTGDVADEALLHLLDLRWLQHLVPVLALHRWEHQIDLLVVGRLVRQASIVPGSYSRM